MQRVLFVLTNHDRIGPADDAEAEATGFHLFEAAMPWAMLTDAGFAVDIATPRGGKAPIDPTSRDGREPESLRFLGDPDVSAAIEHSRALADMRIDRYDALYFPGGYGAMWDLPNDADIARTVSGFFDSGRVVAAVCHGPAALVDVRRPGGDWLVEGREIACFTDDEERAMKKDTLMPFLLGTRLRERGARLRSAAVFEAAVAVSDRLVTGQNPASAAGVGRAMLDLLR
ncbi:MAG: type 1 glutamine amidotransferase domain-containing protein [Pseudomonadota bacterium]